MERGSRWAMLNDFADHHAHGLGVAAVAVWLLLFRHADRDGRVSVSQSRITRALGCHVRTVRRALTKLRRLGLVTVVTPGSRATGPAVLVLALPIGDKKCPHIGDKKYPDGGQKVPIIGDKKCPPYRTTEGEHGRRRKSGGRVPHYRERLSRITSP